MWRAARRLWNNFTTRKLYITGGAGATETGEAFAPDYVLPNDGYLETCAAIGGAFFDHRMNLALGHAEYVDELERALYNSALAGVSSAGNTYSYVNPLQFERGHGRWPWHGCPCCPPMFLKIMGALPGYIYAQEKEALYVNLFVGSTAKVKLAGQEVVVRQKTRYPWDGQVRVELQPEKEAQFALYIRIPGWSGTSGGEALYQWSGAAAPKLKVNGRKVQKLEMVRGYARLERTWKANDVVELALEMPVRRVQTHPKVKENQGLVALARGPLVYAIETTGPEFRARNVFLPEKAALKAVFRPELCGGVTVIRGDYKVRRAGGEKARSVKLEAIPYFAYGNGKQGDLRVWLPQAEKGAVALTRANTAKATASHCWREDHLEAINDGVVPAKSSDNSKRRLSWWEHKGSTEWVQYEFASPTKVSKARVFWFADRPVRGGCDLPETWRLLYRRDGKWVPVEGASGFGVEPDRFNETTFREVKTTGVRVEVQLRAGWSGGVCEWEVE